MCKVDPGAKYIVGAGRAIYFKERCTADLEEHSRPELLSKYWPSRGVGPVETSKVGADQVFYKKSVSAQNTLRGQGKRSP